MSIIRMCLASTLLALALTQSARAERYNAEPEGFLAQGAIVAVATVTELGPAIKPAPNAFNPKTGYEWVTLKTDKILAGTIENEFRLMSPWQLTVGKQYIVYVKQGDAPKTYNRLPAANSIEAVNADETNVTQQGSERITALSEIARIERIDDANARFQAQLLLLDLTNKDLQRYAVRMIMKRQGNWPGPPDDPKRIEMLSGLEDILINLISVQKNDDAREYALHRIFSFSIDRKHWPVKLIDACLSLAEKDPSASIRRSAVTAIHGMCQTGLLGPKQSYEAVLPKLCELLQKEPDQFAAKEIAYAITVIGQMKHRELLNGLKELTPEKAFYVSAIIKHWQAEGDSALNIQSSQFDYVKDAKTPRGR